MTLDSLDLLVRRTALQREAMALLFRGDAQKRGGDLDTAIVTYGRLVDAIRGQLEIAQGMGETGAELRSVVDHLVSALTTRADICQSLGDLPSAKRLREEALSLTRRYLGEAGSAKEQRGLSGTYAMEGRFNDALVALAAARDFFEADGNVVEEVRTTVDLADLLHWLGDWERAERELEHARTVAEPHMADDPASTGAMTKSVLAGLQALVSDAGDGSSAVNGVELYRIAVELDYLGGLVAKTRGNLDRAWALFEKVRDHYVRLNVGAAIDYQLADVQVRRGDWRDAFERVRALESEFLRNQNLVQKYPALCRVRAEALLGLERREAALDTVRTGIERLERFTDPFVLWTLQALEARALGEMGRDAEAIAADKRAVETIDGLRSSPMGYRLDSTFLRDKRLVFDAAIRRAADAGDWRACLEFSEAIKSRSLRTRLSHGDREPEAEGPLAERFDTLSRELDGLEYRIFAGSADSQHLRDRRRELLAERVRVLERIRFSSPRWRGVTASQGWDIEALIAHLGEKDQRVLGLHAANGWVTAVLLDAEGGRVARMVLGSETCAALTAYGEALLAEEADPLASDPSRHFLIGARHLVPEAILEHALGGASLVIAPHGDLHLLPWASLIWSGKRLFEYCPVGVLPNLSCLPLLHRSRGAPTGAALVGAPDYTRFPLLSPLAEAPSEIATLAELHRDRLLEPPRTKGEATEAAFRSVATREDAEGAILHAACHASPEPFDPAYSGLLFSDSRVDAGEIARLRIAYADVVLSACSTGWRPVEVDGVVLEGDDFLGLPAAFLEAGAGAVLVSVPPADDRAAAAFTTAYHRSRVDGETPLHAFRNAQLAMVASGEHPVWSWSGFVLYGCV